MEHTEDVDPCHLQIYHGYINVEETCDHNTHVHAEFEKCEWCKFVSPARENFSSSTNTSLFYSSLVSNLYSIIQKNECSTYFANQSNRGPPLA
ncbi:MAG: hypothetical protein KJO64_04330 [Bacteroidia bacterium]|nr:hypothetical protein [Bacteroidia bacterium]